jgi:hypothetical protein
MMIDAPKIGSNWRDSSEEIKNYFIDLPVDGRKVLKFIDDVSLLNLYILFISIGNESVKATAFVWFKQEDYRRSLSEFGVQPTIQYQEIVLPQSETADIENLYNQLLIEPEEKLIKRKGVLILDGSQYHLSLMENGKIVRRFDFDSAYETYGSMEYIMKFEEENRRRFKSE